MSKSDIEYWKGGSLDVSKTKYVPIPHIQQKENWDCGIACIKMLLPPYEFCLLNYSDALFKLDEGIASRRIWTIDLAYLLSKFRIPFVYLTATIGISPELCNHNYYKKIIELDRERLYKRFSEAKENGIKIVREVTHLMGLMRHISECGPLIVLVNAKYLTCTRCEKNYKMYQNVDFQGHYIILVGYNIERNHVLYHDPSSNHGPCNMSFSDLEDARNSSGTDYDVIKIFDR